MEATTEAGVRWASALADWAIPEEILAQAPNSPWQHATATFVVDDTLDRSVVSAEVARSVLPPAGATVLDVGCGGGRAAMSLVPPAERVIGVDESPQMLAAFTTAAADAGVRSMTLQGRWPDVAADAPVADVVVCHHVAYNVGDIEPFVLALTDHARLAVVLVAPPVHPRTAWSAAWRHFWDLGRPTAPTGDDLEAVLRDLGLEPERFSMPRPPLSRHADDPASKLPALRRSVCLDERWSDDELLGYLDANPPAWSTEHLVFRWPGSGDRS